MGYIQNLLGRNERIAFLTRQHWIVLLRSLLANAFLFAVIVAFVIALGLLLPLAAPLTLVPLVLLFIPLIAFVVRLLNWWNEQYIITNRRVIQTEGLLNKHVIDSSLEKVNDVDLNQSVVGRLLGYGTVQIITGSDIGVNKFHRISNPVRFKRAMLNAKEQLQVKAEFGPEEPSHPEAPPDDAGDTAPEPPVSGDDIPEVIAELAELHEKGVITEEEFQAKKTELLDRL